MFYKREHVDKWDVRISKLTNNSVLFCIYGCAILFGFLFSSFGNFIGMSVGMEGVEYYREAHLSGWNSFIHMLCMPYTTYGILLAFPYVLGFDKLCARVLIETLFLTYGTHYLTVNPVIGLLFIIIYCTPILLACRDYKYTRRNFMKGFLIAFTSLSIQEYIGHYIGGDIPSRVEAIPNAIVYANFYASYVFFL